MFGLDDCLKVHLGNSFGQSNDGLELSNSDGDSVCFLRDLLIFGGRSISHVHVLQHVPGFFTQARENLHLCVGQVLLEHIKTDFCLTVRSHLVHVEVDHVGSDFLVKLLDPMIPHNEDCVETRKNR